MNCRQLFFGLGVAGVLAFGAQANVGADREKFASRGCVSWPADVNDTGRQAVLVWSGGQVFSLLTDMRFKPVQPYPIGTTGTWVPMFFLIDETGDFEQYLGLNVQVSGDLAHHVDPGTIKIEQDGDYTVTEFEVQGRETRVRVPNEWLGTAIGDLDAKYDVAVRTVDMKRVTVLGSCWTE